MSKDIDPLYDDRLIEPFAIWTPNLELCPDPDLAIEGAIAASGLLDAALKSGDFTAVFDCLAEYGDDPFDYASTVEQQVQGILTYPTSF